MGFALLLAVGIWVALGQPGGRNGLLLVLGLGFAGIFWQTSLILALVGLALAGVGLIVWLLATPLRRQQRQALQSLVAAADERYRQDPCRFQGGFGTIQALQLNDAAQPPRIEVLCRTLADTSDGLVPTDHRIPLTPGNAFDPPRTPRQVGTLMAQQGVTLLADLSVEAKAVRAAMEALRERDLTQRALARLAELQADVDATLALAPGNELLQPSVPQLQQARERFATEEIRLREAHTSSDTILRKLHDFLQVPADIQPILNFDLDALVAELDDPTRYADLEELFSEVVELNAIYRQLEGEKLA
jgi:hypothetical protein